jgi:hypothetical protein
MRVGRRAIPAQVLEGSQRSRSSEGLGGRRAADDGRERRRLASGRQAARQGADARVSSQAAISAESVTSAYF